MAKKSDPKELARTYETLRQSVVARVKDPKLRQQALARFDSDPRAQKLRRAAGLASVTTRQRDVRDVARANVAQEGKAKRPAGKNFADAMIAGTSEAMFGIPERLEAAGRYFLPETSKDKRKGTLRRGQSYDETLELVRAENEERKKLSLAGNITGQIGGSIAGGLGAARAVTATGARLAASATPAAARAGNVLQKVERAATLQRGQTARNAARLVGTGAAAGAAQAAGEGSDIAEGAGYGAAAGAGLGVAGKVAPWLGGKASEVFRMSGADAIFRRYTKTTREALEARAADFRKRTGTEPTIYELLDLEDRKSLQDVFQRLDKPQQERGATMARERVEAIPGEVAQVVRNETRGQRKRNIASLASALPKSRGGQAATTAEARLAVGAAENPTRLAQLRRQEARNTMAPFDDQRPINSVEEMVPTELQQGKNPGEIIEVEIDPEMSKVIRAAAGLARIRPSEQGISVREITDMISRLKEAASGKGSVIDQGAAQRAADHLEGLLGEKIPDLAPALARMNENWAARSRQIEGMAEIRPQADVNPNSMRNLRRSENVFETPEGGVGRAMGQRGALIDDLGAATSPALGTVRTLAESPTAARQIAQNIGVPATRNITDAAAAQSESARRLATAVRDPSFDASEIEAGDLALLAAALNPASMAYTKANAIARVYQRLAKSIPESQSRTIVDMLFSRDPAMTQRAINALRSQGDDGGKVLQEIVAIAGMASAGDGEAPEAKVEMAAAEESGNTLEGAPEPIIPGNLPLDIVYQVENEDGSVSTVRTISIGTEQGEVLIPTVINGKVVSDEEAIAHFERTGENFGTFRSPEEATAFAERLHQMHEEKTQSYSQMSDEELLAALEAEEAETAEADYSQMSDEELLAALEAEKEMEPYGRRVIEDLFPDAQITDDLRDPNSDLGKKNPSSYHVGTDGAVDIRPIPGMTFDEFVNTVKAEGYDVVEAIDETGKGRSKHATGPHWHIVIG